MKRKRELILIKMERNSGVKFDITEEKYINPLKFCLSLIFAPRGTVIKGSKLLTMLGLAKIKAGENERQTKI